MKVQKKFKMPPFWARLLIFKGSWDWRALWAREFVVTMTIVDKKQGLSNTKIDGNNQREQFSVAVGRTEITRFPATSPDQHTPRRACGLVHLVKGLVTLCAGVLTARLSFFRSLGKGNMSENLVTCNCQNCNGKIKFDSDQLDKDGTLIAECPHCKLETKLFIPRTKEEKSFEQEFSIKFLAKQLALKIYKAKGAERFERIIFGITRLFALFWAVIMLLTLLLLSLEYIGQLFSRKSVTSDLPPPTFTGSIIQSEGWQKFGIFLICASIILTMLSVISIVLLLLTIERNSRNQTESNT